MEPRALMKKKLNVAQTHLFGRRSNRIVYNVSQYTSFETYKCIENEIVVCNSAARINEFYQTVFVEMFGDAIGIVYG